MIFSFADIYLSIDFGTSAVICFGVLVIAILKTYKEFFK